MKKFIAVAILATLTLSAARAQSAAEQLDYKPAPYMFIGLQGGGQTTFWAAVPIGRPTHFTNNPLNQGLEEKLTTLRSEHHGSLTCHSENPRHLRGSRNKI